jgi:hypothetical protein
MSRNISFTSRRESSKRVRKVFLIVCEGSKTEPSYFSSFRLPKHVFDIEGCGANTGTVVNEAIRLSKEKVYDEVWCVFDRDSFPRQNVNSAIVKAAENGFNVAFSNESFELWYVLHFCYLDAALNRQQYCDKLTELLGEKYEKNSNRMYERLTALQPEAIKNAKRLERNVTNTSWSNRIPYTGVHLLVQRLNSYAKKYAGQ